MAPVRSTAVSLEYLDHDAGHWCNRCNLSTGLRIWVVVGHLGRAHVQERLWCHECQGRDVTVDPDVPVA